MVLALLWCGLSIKVGVAKMAAGLDWAAYLYLRSVRFLSFSGRVLAVLSLADWRVYTILRMELDQNRWGCDWIAGMMPG
jgi:hypothetical protein